MIYKRMTQKLKEKGVDNIVIVKRLWGATPEYVDAKRQRSTCFKTPQLAYDAVISGFRPEIVS